MERWCGGTGRKSCLHSRVTGRASSDLSVLPRWHLRLNRFLAVTREGGRGGGGVCQPHLLPTLTLPSPPRGGTGTSLLIPDSRTHIARGTKNEALNLCCWAHTGRSILVGLVLQLKVLLWVSPGGPLGVGKLRHAAPIPASPEHHAVPLTHCSPQSERF